MGKIGVAAGGIPPATKVLLTPSNIRAGVHIKGGGVDVTGTFTSDGTVQPTHMLAGKIAYVKGAKVTGTIPSRAATTITPGTANQTIAAGQYLEGAQTIAGSANLVASNIRRGVNIFGVTGTASVLEPTLTYIFNEGAVNTAVVGKLVSNGWSISNNRLENWTYDYCFCYFEHAIDISNFRTLSFIQWCNGGYTNSGHYIRVGLATAPGGTPTKYATLSNSNESRVSASVDISGLTGYYYIKVEKYQEHQHGVYQIMLGI